jgi:hypothetical protein
MSSLIHIFKVLYAYCTDFVINLANLSGLSYYEVNFVIFIIIYPALLFFSPILYIYQKSRLRVISNEAITRTKTESESYFNNINTFNKRTIFISANIGWLFIIILGTMRALSESTKYYEYHLLKGDYRAEADSISIPIFQETFFAFLILTFLLVFLNIFILFTTRKANLPTKLFIKADFLKLPVVLWELFFGFWLATSLLFLFYWFWIGYYYEVSLTLFFTFILLNLRSGQISRYKTTKNSL